MKNLFRKLFEKLIREIYSPLEILLISKMYKSDRNYKLNDNVEKCFEDRVDFSGDDAKLLIRISSAYKKGAYDIQAHSEVFRPSNEWLPIYKHSFKECIQALEECNISDLNKIYRNFWREPCSTGLVGLPVDMSSVFFGKNKKISYLNKTLYLNDSIHRFNLWKKLLGDRFSSESLISPLIGNPYGYFIDNKFFKSGADYQHYYATRINDLISSNEGDRQVVVEIGGGFGGMAYYLVRDTKNTTYIDFDLPENLALTSYYLLKAFPDKKVLLYGEVEFDSAKLSDYDIVLMPSFMLDSMKNECCNLIFNSYSLAEMSPKTIRHYVSKSENMIKNEGWFFHVNHTKYALVSARDFPISDDLLLVSEEVAEWNLGRNRKMDEYEFLYKKVRPW